MTTKTDSTVTDLRRYVLLRVEDVLIDEALGSLNVVAIEANVPSQAMSTWESGGLEAHTDMQERLV